MPTEKDEDVSDTRIAETDLVAEADRWEKIVKLWFHIQNPCKSIKIIRKVFPKNENLLYIYFKYI